MSVDKDMVYSNLRDEIMDLIKRQDTYLLAAITMTITVLSFSLQFGNEWVALLPLLILLPMSKRFSDFRYGIVFLASYMAVFLEEKSPTGWEYMREEYYKTQNAYVKKRKQKHRKTRLFKNGSNTFTFTARGMFVLLTAVSISAFWINHIVKYDPATNTRLPVSLFDTLQNTILSIVLMIFQAVCILYQVIQEIKYRDISETKKILFEEWEYVQKKTK